MTFHMYIPSLYTPQTRAFSFVLVLTHTQTHTHSHMPVSPSLPHPPFPLSLFLYLTNTSLSLSLTFMSLLLQYFPHLPPSLYFSLSLFLPLSPSLAFSVSHTHTEIQYSSRTTVLFYGILVTLAQRTKPLANPLAYINRTSCPVTFALWAVNRERLSVYVVHLAVSLACLLLSLWKKTLNAPLSTHIYTQNTQKDRFSLFSL